MFNLGLTHIIIQFKSNCNRVILDGNGIVYSVFGRFRKMGKLLTFRFFYFGAFVNSMSHGSSNQPLLALNIIDSSIKQSFFIYLGITIFGARAVPLRRVTLCNPCNIHRSLYYNNCHINMYELNFEDHTATFKLSSFCPQYIKNA